MRFVGRTLEQEELESLYRAPDAKLVVVYGRRRIGKSTLIEKFIQNKPHLSLEGLEKVRTKGQLHQATHHLAEHIADPLLRNATFEDWASLFDYLTHYFSNSPKKQVLFLDEFQWLAVNQSKLVSIIKSYWDRHWSKQNVMLILCGSVSSYMVKRVIRSKALYGRINWELCLQPLAPNEIAQLLDHKRSQDEILLYSMILGGIPKYLKEIDPHKSFEQNMNRLFFMRNSLFSEEYHRIFFSQFKEHKIYESIIQALRSAPLSQEEIAKATSLSSGGGLKSYLNNLERSAFITHYVPYNKAMNSKLIKYKLTDEYLRFYFKYIIPHLKLIQTNSKHNLFTQLVKPHWQPWLGFAFENFCLKNAMYLAEKMGFAHHVLQWGPLFHQGDTQFQVDLIYERQDNVITVCELKYYNKPISVSVVHEVERKCALIQLPRGYTMEKALITRFGIDDALKTLNYFHHVLTIDDFFKSI